MAMPEYAEKPISFRLPIETQEIIDKWVRDGTKSASVVYREVVIAGLVALGKMSRNGNNKVSK